MCLSNIKQLTQGIIMYTGDYDEVLPQNDCQAMYEGSQWDYVVMPYIKNAKVHECPSDPSPRYVGPGPHPCGVSSAGPRPPIPAWVAPHSISYGMNYRIRQLRSTFATMSESSTLFLLTESLWPWVTVGTKYTMTPYLRFRHMEGANVSFVDGHAKWFSKDALNNGRGVKNDEADPG